jgi:hypothetical protein
MFSVRMVRGYRRESTCVFVKGTWQEGVQSEWVRTTLFRGYCRKIRVSSSDSSVMSYRVLKNTVVWTPEENRKRWLGRCPPCTVQPCRKSLRKSFVMYLFERYTVWCSLLVLKMSSSEAQHTSLVFDLPPVSVMVRVGVVECQPNRYSFKEMWWGRAGLLRPSRYQSLTDGDAFSFLWTVEGAQVRRRDRGAQSSNL